MLISFSVENFLSFNDVQTISLEASRDKALRQNVIANAQDTKYNLLRSAVIYGPNASGKSNLIKAMSFMMEYVIFSAKGKPADTPTGALPFKLCASNLDKPSTFLIEFISHSVRYQYGFALQKSHIVEEWLHSYPENRKRTLFTRNYKSDASIEQDYYWGPNWSGEAKRLAELTRPDILFISVASQFNHPIASNIVSWFQNCFRGIRPNPFGAPEEAYTLNMCEDDPTFKTNVLEIIRNADLAIHGFEIHRLPINEGQQFNFIPADILKKILRDLGADPEKTEIPRPIFIRNGTDHNGNKTVIKFEEHEESDGTLKLFALAGPIHYALSKGCCLFADELDNSLHPLLTQAIIELFHHPEINNKGAQIIFATHDVNLLEVGGLFRRDQVWLTEKDETGATHLTSLWDYKIRKGENLRRGYLSGKYGGVPFIEKLVHSQLALNHTED